MLRFRTLLPLLRPTAALILLLTVALPTRAARAELDEYDYHRDGGAVMSVLDDPGNGGPAPAAIPLGSDATLATLALLGGLYATKGLRRATPS
jgi:hypothetical protein